MFMVLLSSDNLSNSDRWWQKARIWRLAFLQRADGSWVPGRGLELSLLSNYRRAAQEGYERSSLHSSHAKHSRQPFRAVTHRC